VRRSLRSGGNLRAGFWSCLTGLHEHEGEDPHVISRREIVLGGTAAAAIIELAILPNWALAQVASLGKFEIVKSDKEWRREFTSEQYAVLRRRETERPWTSPFNKEYRPGAYLCAGSGLPLFSSSTKFESGTGWPSFWAPIDGAMETSEDRSFFFLDEVIE
jgi:peptide-methionine (R)-S-oxide reductase